MDIYTTKKEAIEAGANIFQGNPCKYGHTERYVKSGGCVKCTEIRNKKYREENPEKEKARKKKYREENPEKEKARQKKWRVENPDYDKEWREKNPERVKVSNKKWKDKNSEQENLRSKKYREANPERVKVNNKNWREKNPERTRQHSANRIAAKLQRTPPWVDHEAIRVFYDESVRLTNETGIPYQVDHIIPLQGKLVSGLHVHTNLQVITAEENRKKTNSFSIA